MNTFNNDRKFGLVLPNLSGIVDKDEMLAAIKKNTALIDQVSTFLEKNGADRISCTGKVYMIGSINSLDAAEPIIGLTFYGSMALARQLAAAFPKERVVSYSGDPVSIPGTPRGASFNAFRQQQRPAGPRI